MPIYKIRGIDVDFPFEAYDCQIVYMEKVIQSLQDKCNALLESPTGTGKTLCLLCATLAWRRSLGDFSSGANEGKSWNSGNKNFDVSPSPGQSGGTRLPTIVYSTRTHSQLHQVIQELKRTNYRPKMVVLGSREQLCIHDDVRMLRGRAQTNACQFLRKRHKCAHHGRVSDYVKQNPNLGADPIDIEDLVNIGRTQGPCPYYLSRELHKSVDILFAPYNYLIDLGNRKSLSIEWQSSVLIFDEAHNLESICADAASFDIPSGLLTACISEAKKCVELSIARREIEKSNDKSLSPDNFAILRALLLKLEKRIAEVPIASKELGFTRPGPYIYELLADLNITHETATMLLDTIDSAVSLLEDAENATASGPNKTEGVCRLESMGDILRIIFRDGDKAHAKSYRVHVHEAEARAFDAFQGKATRTLSWWCFNPGIALEQFSGMGVGSIILTSGTLSPLDSFAQELKLKFPIRLENPHVISSDQIWAGVVPTGPSGCSFNSSYRNRDSLEYKQELGNAIANFARIVPDGLLVFFPSYYILDQCIGCWKNMSHASSVNSSTIWERICKHKQPVVEPKQSSLFSSSIEDFMTKLNDTSTSGSIFFAVCRGKVSEGLDFADHAGRAVVVTGIPFATRNDPKVRLKREFLDQQAESQNKEYKVLTGEEWYSQEASRAVNQAVGRVIRHRNDYGAIIFCDERFTHPSRQCQMSLWLQPHIKCYSKFGEVVFTLTRFFRERVTPVRIKSNLTKSLCIGSICASKSTLDEEMHKPLGKDVSSLSELSNMVHDNTIGVRITQPWDKFLLANTATHLTTTDEDCSKKPSSVLAANKGKSCSHLGDFLPANRSALTPYGHNRPLTLKVSRDPDGKGQEYQNSEVIDLTCNDHWSEKPEELIVNCSSKKPKLLKINPDAMLHSEKHLSHEKLYDVKKTHLSNISEKHGKQSQLCLCGPAKDGIHESSRNRKLAQVGSAVVLENSTTSQNTAFKLMARKDIGGLPSSAPSDEETKGSAFLIKVQEMLTPAEYIEFVGYMKALKSKTMKTSQVLQLIARLFSTPERHLLLERFKDYIPAKYRSMYCEQHLRNLDAAVDS